MQQINKVIRIGINSDLFLDELSSDVTEMWFNLDDIKENDFLYNYLKENEIAALTFLEAGKADFLSIYSDI